MPGRLACAYQRFEDCWTDWLCGDGISDLLDAFYAYRAKRQIAAVRRREHLGPREH